MPHIVLSSHIKVFTYKTAQGPENKPMVSASPPVGTAVIDEVDVRIESYNASGLGPKTSYYDWCCRLPFQPGYLTADGISDEPLGTVLDHKVLCMFMVGHLGGRPTKASVHPREGEPSQEQIDYEAMRGESGNVFEDKLESFLSDLSVDR